MAEKGNKLSDGLKKFLLVGIGAAATTVEKSQEIIEDLAKKGEITVEQSKDLQQNMRNMFEKTGNDAEELAKKLAKLPEEQLDNVRKLMEDIKKKAEEAKAEEEAELAEEELKKAEEEMYKEEGAPSVPLEAPAEEKPEEEEKAEA